MKLKLKSILIKIQACTYLFAWITVILFAFFHPDFQSLTKELYEFLLYTPLGILMLYPQNTEWDDKLWDDKRYYFYIPLLCLLTLWYDFIVWKFFITSLVN